jgi:hypothetical protein
VRLLVGMYGAWALVTGALNVLSVVAAIELLDLGEGGVGLLTAAIGIGGLAGAVAALALAVRKRLAGFLALGTVVWSAPIALLGAWPEPVVAVLLLGVLGLGNILSPGARGRPCARDAQAGRVLRRDRAPPRHGPDGDGHGGGAGTAAREPCVPGGRDGLRGQRRGRDVVAATRLRAAGPVRRRTL